MSKATTIVAVGDSLTYGFDRWFWQAAGLDLARASTGETGPRYSLNQASDGNIVFYNCAMSGWHISNLVTQAPIVDAVLNPSYSPDSGGSGGLTTRSTRNMFLVVMIGTNSDNAAASDEADDIAAYCSARAAAGWRVIICTIPSRTDGSYGTDAGFRAPLNAILRSQAWMTTNNVEACCDFGAIPILAPNGTNGDNARYFSDKVHPTQLASALMAHTFAETMRSLGVRFRACYVSGTSGNNGTAEVNNPSLPFATLQAALDAWSAAYHAATVSDGNGPCNIVFLDDVGDGSQVTLNSTMTTEGIFLSADGAAVDVDYDLRLSANGAIVVIAGVTLSAASWADNASTEATDAGTITAFNGGKVSTLSLRGAVGADGTTGANGSTSTGNAGQDGADGDPPENGGTGGTGDAPGAVGTNGEQGGFGRSLSIDGFTAASANADGGNGGSGGAGGAGGTATGGAGGAGGDSTGTDQNGGDGGAGGAAGAGGSSGGDGGNGGDGGSITRYNGASVTTFSAAGGAGGVGGGGGLGGSATGGAGGAGGAGSGGGATGAQGADGTAENADGPAGAEGSAGAAGSLI